MILIEEHPRVPAIAQFVDRYQLFSIDEDSYVKAVPNGKIEFYIVSKGGFEQWVESHEGFISNQPAGFLPATNKQSFFRVRKGVVCINIKLKLTVLALPYFHDVLTNWYEKNIEEWIHARDLEAVRQSISKNLDTIDVDLIEQILLQPLAQEQVNQEVIRLLELVEGSIHSDFKVGKLAEQMNMSSKSLERTTKKHFQLTPKELWQVLRFESTTTHLKRSKHQKLIEALGFGYYDQSHFIKECKRITGYTPTDFFSKLILSTNDLIIEGDQPM